MYMTYVGGEIYARARYSFNSLFTITPSVLVTLSKSPPGISFAVF